MTSAPAAAQLGKATSTARSDSPPRSPIQPLNPTWDESLALLNTRPHPLISALHELPDSDSADEPSTDEDAWEPRRKAAREEFARAVEEKGRRRWAYFAADETDCEAARRRPVRLAEECELRLRWAQTDAAKAIDAPTQPERVAAHSGRTPIGEPGVSLSQFSRAAASDSQSQSQSSLERASPTGKPLVPDSSPAPAAPPKQVARSKLKGKGVLVMDSDEEPDNTAAREASTSTRLSVTVATIVSATPQLPPPSPAVGPSSTPSTRPATGSSKVRKTSVQYLDSLKQKTAFSKHKAAHPTISATLELLTHFPGPVVHKPIFDGCAIIFVNPNSLGTSKIRNAFDVAHPLQMSRLIALGAALLRPEDFSSGRFKPATTPRTTHVIPLEVEHARPPAFDDVLASLGEEGERVGVDELGSVAVVSWRWVTNSLTSGLRAREAGFAFPGDPRSPPASPRKRARGSGTAKLSPSKRKRRGGGDSSDDEASTDEDQRRHQRDGGGEQGGAPHDADTTIEDDIVEGDSVRISSDRFPAHAPFKRGTGPAATRAVLDLTNSPETAHSAGAGGLERELALVKELGPAAVDHMLDAADSDNDFSRPDFDETFVFSARAADNETDEEDDDDDDRAGRVARQERIKRGGLRTTEGKYACERVNTGGVGQAVSPNETVAKVLEAMGELVKKDKMRQRAYRIAAGALRNRQDKVESYEDALAIRGVGKKIALKVVEIIKTGTLRRIANKTEREKCTELFTNVFGVGTKIAEDFFDLGCRTLNDVRTVPASKGRPLSDAQQLGLRYYDDLLRPIPREEVTAFHRLAVEAAATIDSQLQVLCMGSYIRGARECGDVDFIVTRDTADGRDHRGMIRSLWDRLKQCGMIRHSLAAPSDWDAVDVKYNGLCALPGSGRVTMRRLDMLGVPWAELPAARIYFTGNDFFNRSMRLKAAHMGYRLNQRGLWQDVARGKNKERLTHGVRVPGVETERDIFRVLEVEWREPHERLA